jgi:poly(beta-D-mannuronate) lyase
MNTARCILLHFVLCTYLAVTGPASIAKAATVVVGGPGEFADACTVAAPGDTIVLRGGDWRDVQLVFRANGTAEAPITMRAGQPGGTKLTGASRLEIAGDHLVVSGLVFTEGAAEREPIVTFGEVDGRHPEHCRLTELAFVRYNPPDPATRYTWVQVRGHNHRVDHCRFDGQNHRGITLQVVVGDGNNRVRIDHNHFVDRAAGTGNGFETIQIAGQQGKNDSYSTFEYNLFENCDGEQEIISNKSSHNTYRKNTFRGCNGALTLRDGDSVTVEANVFLGDGKAGSSGVRVIDSGHVIRGNYFQGLTGRGSTGGIIALYAGVPPAPHRLYMPADDAVIENNVLVQNAANAINLSAGYQNRNRVLLPRNVALRGNWIDLDPRQGVTVLTGMPGEQLTCSGNFYSPSSEMGFLPTEGFAQTPATIEPDAPVPILPELAPPETIENDGWAAVMAALEPLSPRDVGPTWWPHNTPAPAD